MARKVFLFSNQTVVSITFNEGAVLKSLPIRADLLALSSPNFPNFDTVSFGIADESENKYILGVPTTSADTTATQYYIYNYITDAWTQWTFPFAMKTGIVNPTNDLLYFGSGDSTSRYVRQERNNGLATDYADDSYPVTIVSSSTYTVELTDTTGLQAGWVIAQSDRKAIILSVIDSSHLLLNENLMWVAGAATVYRPIPIALEFILESMGNPGIIKHFKEVHTIFSLASFQLFKLGFKTDFSPNTTEISLIPKSADGFGLGGFGEFPWGSGALDTQVIRGLVPLTHRRGHWLILSINYADALTYFGLDGFAIYYQQMSQKFH